MARAPSPRTVPNSNVTDNQSIPLETKVRKFFSILCNVIKNGVVQKSCPSWRNAKGKRPVCDAVGLHQFLDCQWKSCTRY